MLLRTRTAGRSGDRRLSPLKPNAMSAWVFPAIDLLTTTAFLGAGGSGIETRAGDAVRPPRAPGVVRSRPSVPVQDPKTLAARSRTRAGSKSPASDRIV